MKTFWVSFEFADQSFSKEMLVESIPCVKEDVTVKDEKGRHYTGKVYKVSRQYSEEGMVCIIHTVRCD